MRAGVRNAFHGISIGVMFAHDIFMKAELKNPHAGERKMIPERKNVVRNVPEILGNERRVWPLRSYPFQ